MALHRLGGAGSPDDISYPKWCTLNRPLVVQFDRPPTRQLWKCRKPFRHTTAPVLSAPYFGFSTKHLKLMVTFFVRVWQHSPEGLIRMKLRNTWLEHIPNGGATETRRKIQIQNENTTLLHLEAALINAQVQKRTLHTRKSTRGRPTPLYLRLNFQK